MQPVPSIDQTLDWTQEHLADWYGQEKLPLDEKQKSTSAAVLWLLSGDAAQRTISAWHFGWEPARYDQGIAERIQTTAR